MRNILNNDVVDVDLLPLLLLLLLSSSAANVLCKLPRLLKFESVM